MNVYISGKISGENPELVKQKFQDAEADIEKMGYSPVSPLDNDIPWDAPWEEHMRADIKAMLDCDKVYALRDWDKSQGAQLEVFIAHKLSIPIIFQS